MNPLHPPLLYDRPPMEEFVVAVVVPTVFGIVTGLLLGVSEVVYLVLQVLGIAGGYLAGLEHDRPIEGVYRGLLGGLLFGVWILAAHGISGADAKADLVDPEALLPVITALFGAGLGALGARRRARGRAVASSVAA